MFVIYTIHTSIDNLPCFPTIKIVTPLSPQSSGGGLTLTKLLESEH